MKPTREALAPYDEYNRALEDNVHPRHWTNPTPQAPYHLVVIGAGTAGLVTAAGAAGLGARVALIERDLMGGDCLNIGCVPSKALLGAARVAATVRDAGEFGVAAEATTVDFAEVMQRMRRLRAEISPADSAERFQKLGVDVYFGQGRFVDGNTITVEGTDGVMTSLPFKKAVIATGARAAAPPIPGLDNVDYLTNESLFSLTALPSRLAVIGGGPIGCEMAQAFARFGSEVALYEQADRILPRDDADAAAVVQRQMERDGVALLLESQDMKVGPAEGDAIRIEVTRAGKSEVRIVDKLLIAAGRKPNIDGMNLDAVRVDSDDKGIVVNDFLQTTNPRVYAAGDVCSRFQFTHAADFMARIVIQNALFAVGPLGRKRASKLVIPWATYTSPELAHVGMSADEAQKIGADIDTYVQPLAENDRAVLDGKASGFVKVHTRAGTGTIVGATIVAEHAGDLISEITVAMTNGVGLSQLASTIHPYPTQADAIRRLGDQFNRTRLSSFNKRILGWLRWLNVGR